MCRLRSRSPSDMALLVGESVRECFVSSSRQASSARSCPPLATSSGVQHRSRYSHQSSSRWARREQNSSMLIASPASGIEGGAACPAFASPSTSSTTAAGSSTSAPVSTSPVGLEALPPGDDCPARRGHQVYRRFTARRASQLAGTPGVVLRDFQRIDGPHASLLFRGPPLVPCDSAEPGHRRRRQPEASRTTSRGDWARRASLPTLSRFTHPRLTYPSQLADTARKAPISNARISDGALKEGDRGRDVEEGAPRGSDSTLISVHYKRVYRSASIGSGAWVGVVQPCDSRTGSRRWRNSNEGQRMARRRLRSNVATRAEQRRALDGQLLAFSPRG